MNFADSDEMGRHLKSRGFDTTAEPTEADAILVNTCTVRDLAEHKASSYIGTLKEWKDENPHRILIVTGCAAERAKMDFKKRFPYLDLIVGAKDIERFPDQLDALLTRDVIDEKSLLASAGNTVRPVISYVTIMRGCNYNCTYCIVPSVRGREVYRPVEEILKDVEARVSEGAKEVWLLGQTVNSYKPEGRPDYDFADLLREVDQVSGLERTRFMSPHPYYLSTKLIEAMADCRTVCEHLHLPVQSGSNKILHRMKRNYTKESYLTNVHRLKQAIPNIALTTDLIVGFPGETLEDFEATLKLVEEANFDSAYCFQYSPRPGTASAEWADDVLPEEKERRVNRLLELVDAKGAEKVKSLVGTMQDVLIEDDKGDDLFRGKTRTAWRVRLRHPSLKVGDLVQVKITGTHSRELHGELAQTANI